MPQHNHANPISGGSGAVFLCDRLPVFVFVAEFMRDMVVDGFKALEEALPPRGPRFDIKIRSPRPCSALNKNDFPEECIVICSQAGGTDGVTKTTTHRHTLGFVKIVLGEADLALSGEAYVRNTICHEGMHAISWVNDNYDYPHGSTSCVQGELLFPGSWDRDFLRYAYKEHDRKEKEEAQNRERREQEKEKRRNRR